MKPYQDRVLSFAEKLRNLAYNTKYNINSLFEYCPKESFANPNQSISILGRTFWTNSHNLPAVRNEVYEIFESTAWITYRSGFPELLNEVKGSYVSDTGWGCMVRVGQMLFAQVIKAHRKASNRQDILNIISLFSDFKMEEPFSIHRIAREARLEYKLKPGDWYNPSQISYILADLHERHLAKTVHLKFVVFNSGSLFFDTICSAMLSSPPICNCLPKSTNFVCKMCNKCLFSVSVIVLTRLGLETPDPKYLHILCQLIKSEFSQGIIGGKPQRALYFIGLYNDSFIYLDPHYVHKADKNSENQTYFCESLRMCKIKSIDSSVGICFYLRNVDDLNRFRQQMNNLKEEYYEDFFLYVADETPPHMKYIEKASKKNYDEDKFQKL